MIQLQKKYEDNLYYPVWVNHRLVEMSGKDINEYNRRPPSIVELEDRLTDLENKFSKLVWFLENSLTSINS